jgi:cytochrome c biogenesis protein CcdA
LVSLFELACTGQVYFPVIVHLVRTERQVSSFAYLLLYNLGFIVPLLVVFGLTYFGVQSAKITAFFQRSMGGVKIALAGLFVVLAVLTVVT